jgi:hypothetical protein
MRMGCEKTREKWKRSAKPTSQAISLCIQPKKPVR